MNGIPRISSVHLSFQGPCVHCIFPNVLARNMYSSVCVVTIAMFLSTYYMYPHVALATGWGPNDIKKMSEVGTQF